jgi:hypothetical protein
MKSEEKSSHIPPKKFLLFPLSILSFIFSSFSVHAHCPLCTMGAAAAAGGALWLGISPFIVAIFIGAFAISMGLWIGKMIKKEYVKYQIHWLALISFLTTVLPIYPLLKTGTPADYYPFMISWVGEYGSLLNRTYLIGIPLVMAVLGGAIVYAAPFMSNKISTLRGKTLPFQGVSLTLLLLVIVAALLQWVM